MNKFLASFIIFISFLLPLNSYANNQMIVKDSIKINMNYKSEYFADTSVFFETQKPYQMIQDSNNIETVNPYLWLTSLLFPGLGQILMGDLSRGLRFISVITFGTVLFIGALGFAIVVKQDKPKSYFSLITSLFSFITVIISYISNIFDAYNMFQELSEVDNIKAK